MRLTYFIIVVIELFWQQLATETFLLNCTMLATQVCFYVHRLDALGRKSYFNGLLITQVTTAAVNGI